MHARTDASGLSIRRCGMGCDRIDSRGLMSRLAEDGQRVFVAWMRSRSDELREESESLLYFAIRLVAALDAHVMRIMSAQWVDMMRAPTQR